MIIYIYIYPYSNIKSINKATEAVCIQFLFHIPAQDASVKVIYGQLITGRTAEVYYVICTVVCYTSTIEPLITVVNQEWSCICDGGRNGNILL